MADKAKTATALMTARHDTLLEGPALHFSADAKQRAANFHVRYNEIQQCKFLNHERLKVIIVSHRCSASAKAGTQSALLRSPA
jgi:hypothetical protein